MKRKVALITGITGQDGSYLAEILVKKNYIVHGIRRRTSNNRSLNLSNFNLIPQMYQSEIKLHYGDLTDGANLFKILNLIKPDEIYNLAALSDVHLSFKMPEYTANVNSIGLLKLIDAAKTIVPNSKFYQASTSEMYGDTTNNNLKNEQTKFNPCSPYASSKLFAHNIVSNYRDMGYFACNGILFNHESPRRGSNFITKKVVETAIKIKQKKINTLYVGNLYSKRDWGYAKEYVECMWRMLKLNKPVDLVIATGKSYSVKYLIDFVFKYLGFDIKWKGSGKKEIAFDKKTKKILVKIDDYYFRPNEVSNLRGDSSLAKKIIKWDPKTNFKELISTMIDAELNKN